MSWQLAYISYAGKYLCRYDFMGIAMRLFR